MRRKSTVCRNAPHSLLFVPRNHEDRYSLLSYCRGIRVRYVMHSIEWSVDTLTRAEGSGAMISDGGGGPMPIVNSPLGILAVFIALGARSVALSEVRDRLHLFIHSYLLASVCVAAEGAGTGRALLPLRRHYRVGYVGTVADRGLLGEPSELATIGETLS